MNTIEEIKTLFSQNHIPLFGTAKAASLETEPAGYKPSDLLAQAESILCLGIPIPKGAGKDRKKLTGEQ